MQILKKITMLAFFMLTLGICASAQVTVTGSTGADGSYTTVGAAFTAINAGTQTSNNIVVAISANTTETGPAVLNSGAWNSLTINPTADGVTVAGPTATGRGLIELNGADNVTIDGDNPNTTGTNRNLTFQNTAVSTITYTSVIRVAVLATTQTSADNIIVRNTVLLGNATGRNISTATSTTGSENTTFGIYAGGNGGATVPTAITSVTTNTAPSGTTINNFTASNNSINAVARGIAFNGAAATVAAGTTTMTNNIIGVTGALATTVYTKGLYVGGTTSLNASGNTINLASYVGTAMTAIDLVSPVGATGGTIAINDNNIGSVTQQGTSSANGISQASAVTTFSIARNIVSNVTTPAGGTGATGIGVASTAASPSGVVDRNNVTNIKSNGTSTYAARGISINSGTQITVQNNFVSDIANNASGSGGFGGSFSPIGIYIGGGTNHRIYHNSVNMFGTIAGTASGILSAAFQITGTGITGLDVRNNIFSNTLTGGLSTGSAHVSIALPASGTSALNLTLNNNDYFSGTTAGSQGIAFVGTTYSATTAGPTTYAGLYTAANFNPADTTNTANLRTYTSILSTAGTNDNASIVTDPLFVSTTDLHLQSGSPARNVGANVGVGTDFDGQTRPGANALFDIGADEFDGVTPPANDIAATAIIVPTTGSTFATGSTVTPQASFTNVGTAAQTNVQVQFTIAGPGGYTYSNTQTIASISPNQTVTVTFLATMALTTTGNYTTTATVLTADANSTNNTVTGTFSVANPLSGSVTVGTGGTYTSLTNPGGVFDALNGVGATSNITINITSDLTAETGAISLNQLAGGFTVTIQPSGGAARIISGSNTTALINLNGADGVTIDGLNTGGNSLLIRNTNTTSGSVIRLINDASNNTIARSTVEAGNGSTTILISTGTTTGNDNTTITGNIIRDRSDVAGVAFNGVGSAGTSATITNTGISITNNQITNFNQAGVFIGTGSENVTVTGNDISSTASRTTAQFGVVINIVLGTNTFSQNLIHGLRSTIASTGVSAAGMLMVDARGTTISRNRIYDFPAATAGTGRIVGIEFDGGSGTTASVNIVNNMISLVTSVTTAQPIYGLFDFSYSGNTFTADYNSVYIGGTTSGATPSWAIVRGVSAPSAFTMRNNIAYNNRTGGTSPQFAAGDQSANTGTFVSNYNFFAGTGTTAGSFFDYGTSSTGTPVTFAAWQTGPPTRDANSTAGEASTFNPANFFVNAAAGDLHLISDTITSVSNAGTPITGLTTDFDGQTRSTTTPDIGADEFIPLVPGTLALSSATYSVGEAGGTTTITINRTGGTDGAVAVNYALSGGTATGGATCATGVDYVNTGGTVNFANGVASQTFNVTICNDTVFEGNETFNVTLSNATGGATLGTPATAVVTILDDEVAQNGSLQFSSATYTVGEAGPSVALTVTRTGGTDGAVGASYSFTNGTATGGATCAAGIDFINSSGTVSFTNGQSSQMIMVTICNDTVFEGNETFTATLATPTGGATLGSPTTATVTINDDEVAQNGTLALSAATYTVAENVSGGNLTVTINRTGGTDGAVAVNYALSGGTATGGATCATGVDYVNTGGTVNFANGVASQTFNVTICNDTVFEGNETFNVTLSNATGGATLGSPSSAVVTITDDEVAQNGTVQFSAATYTVTEAGPTATITITRTGGSDGSITVNYATVAGGTATGAAACAAGVDYVNTSGTATFGAGVTTAQTFTIPICNDTVVESSETVNLALTNPTGGATLGTPNTAVLTITDDDVLTGPVTVAATAGTASASYNNLTEAAAAINAGTHQGAITVSINQSITEPAAVVINGSGAGSASYTSILIRPTVDNVSDSGPTVTGRGLIELNGADNVTIDGDNPNSTGTNRNLTLQNTAANTVTFTSVVRVAVAATGTTSADGNTFRNLNILGSATGRNVSTATSTAGTENTTFGIFAGPGASTTDATAAPAAVTSVSTSVATGATATNLIVSNNSFGTAARAVTMNGSATTVFSGLQITGNTIGNPTAGDADQIYAIGITAQGSDNGVISNNTVYVEGYIPTALQGINVGVNSATGTFTIERNMVNRVRNSNGTIYGAYGINIGGGLNHVVQNNFVSGVINNQTAGTAGFGTTFGANGIRSGGGTGHKIYHNSVNLYGAIPGAVSTNLTAAFLISTATQTGLDVRNNIFSNQLTGGNPTGTRNVAIYLPSGATSTMNLTLNNNAYYAGTDANNRLAQVGATFGTGEYQVADFSPAATTPATNFRAYSSTLSAAGTNDNASFASSAPPPFTSNVNLHIPAGTATRLESGGAAVGVTTDIDLETRNTTTPDIGADEFAGQPAPANDIAAVAFVAPASGSTVQTGASFTPQASFLNNGTVTQTNVTVRYRITNSSNTVIYNQTATIATIAPLQIVTVSFPATTLPAAGTYTIQASAELAGDQNTANDSISGTLNAIDPLGGTINVGDGQTYTSLTNAGGVFQALNTAGISGNTVINITSDLTAETGAVALNQLTEAGAGGYTVTFKPSGAARTVSGTAAALSMIKLNGADRIIFDGSLSGGTDRSLTFLYTNTGGTVFWIASANASNGANNNTIINCIIGSNPGTLSVAGILAGSGTTLGGAAESPNSNNTIRNNQISRVQNSLFLFGGATAATLDQNWVIRNNSFGSTVTADKNSFRGMLLGNAQNFTVLRNTVLGLRSAATTTAATTGIQLAGLLNGGSVTKNNITDVKNVSTSGTGAFGMQISATSTASNVTIANNFISDVAANGSATITSNGFGMTFNGSGTGYNVYYNSINMNTDQTTAQTSAALFVNSTFATAGALDVRNNNFVNTQTTGARYAVYSLAAATVFTTINYNDYFAQNVGFIGGSARPTLADWQAATGQDANSKAVDPLFVSATDLHLQATSPVLDMGTPIASVTDDFDGEVRSTTTPDIGADELSAAPQNGIISFATTGVTVQESTASIQVTVTRSNGSSGVASATYTPTSGTATGGATCASGIDFINTPGIVTFADGQTSQTFNVTLCPDSLDKGDENFTIVLSNATGGASIGTPSVFNVSIIDDDPAPTISINSVSQNEGNSGTTPFVFTVSLSAASGQAVTVNYFTADGTATAPSDYTAIPNTVLTFAPGETTKSVTVLVNGDTTPEANETFTVNLATPTNSTIATAQGVGTIVNDDGALSALTINDVRVVEGNSGTVNAVFTVTLSQAATTAVSVNYATANGTATAGSDYVAANGTLNFTAGQTTQTITVAVNGDLLKEANETFFVNLSNASGATIGDNQGLGIIIDDDRAIPADFDKDRKTDFSVFRPSNGFWYVLQSDNNLFNPTLFGMNGDLPVPGDYDGDGATDYAVFRPSNGTWYVQRSSDFAFVATQFGFGTDKPVQGDYDGDGKTDIAVFRPSNGTWYILQSGSNNQFTAVAFGISSDVPVQGDYDGDAKTDVAVYRNGIWYVLNSRNGAVTAINYGAATDKPLVGDFDGDGKADYTVFRAGVWYIFQTLTQTSRGVAFGSSTDIPVVGDYDRDGTSDIAVFRPSNGAWYVLQSSNGGFSATLFGQQNDIPIPAGYQSLQ